MVLKLYLVLNYNCSNEKKKCCTLKKNHLGRGPETNIAFEVGPTPETKRLVWHTSFASI